MKFSIAIIVGLVRGIMMMIITIIIIHFAAFDLIPDSVLPNYSVCFCLREYPVATYFSLILLVLTV